MVDICVSELKRCQVLCRATFHLLFSVVYRFDNSAVARNQLRPVGRPNVWGPVLACPHRRRRDGKASGGAERRGESCNQSNVQVQSAFFSKPPSLSDSRCLLIALSPPRSCSLPLFSLALVLTHAETLAPMSCDYSWDNFCVSVEFGMLDDNTLDGAEYELQNCGGDDASVKEWSEQYDSVRVLLRSGHVDPRCNAICSWVVAEIVSWSRAVVLFHIACYDCT
eukprot:3019544-Rhodomonas_salina.1